MDGFFNAREYGWSKSSDFEISNNHLAEDSESIFGSSGDNELMSIFQRVDLEDRLPRNIRFVRVRVRVDPWYPLMAGFMLRLDDGSRVWIQCRYERIHKLCKRCGLIGHTRRQCTKSMDNIEVSLFRQRLHIQRLHQVQFRDLEKILRSWVGIFVEDYCVVFLEGKVALGKVCRSFGCCSTSIHRSGVQSKRVQIPCGFWQLIVKVAGARLKRMNRARYAFEAKTTHGNSILQGVYSCTDQPNLVIIQGAMLEAALKAKELGFKHILFLNDCRRAVQVNNCRTTASWQEKSLMSDWSYLLANDFVYHSVFVLKMVTSCVFALAKLATKMPIHSYYVHTNP
ncbi:hypothetical protein SO802_034572 [Lithocarpus litseifolius]|uniref:CCHC-type domain-containing protein n=1 Tax=Lithocarpus litseifolius TaxID=425828 RepID=A0AAW2BH00_9ROSI